MKITKTVKSILVAISLITISIGAETPTNPQHKRHNRIQSSVIERSVLMKGLHLKKTFRDDSTLTHASLSPPMQGTLEIGKLYANVPLSVEKLCATKPESERLLKQLTEQVNLALASYPPLVQTASSSKNEKSSPKKENSLANKCLATVHESLKAFSSHLKSIKNLGDESLDQTGDTIEKLDNPSYGLEIKYPKETEGLEGLSW